VTSPLQLPLLPPFPSKFAASFWVVIDASRDRFPKRPWSKFITQDNRKYVSDDALSFLDGLLRYDHQERLTPKEAMEHPYFKPVHDREGK
jgi:serine/threonine protein kinase